MKVKNTVGGGRELYSVKAQQAKKVSLFLFILLFFCTIVLGCAFIMPKNTKIANAGTESDFDGDALAQAANFADFTAMSTAIKNGTTLQAKNFGTYSVNYCNLDWWPVLTTVNGNDEVILTLWLCASIGNFTFSDGTYGTNTTYPSNAYKYSWIRSAINAGQTSDNGDYYGNYSGSALPTKFSSNQAPNASHVAPTSFTTFSALVGNQYVVPGGDYGDYVWLAHRNEASSGGTWGCTSTQWAGTTYFWSRESASSNANCVYIMNSSGGYNYSSPYVNLTSIGVRPAINLNLTNLIGEVAPTDVQVTYNGQTQDISNAAAADVAWYNMNRVTLSYHSDIACTTSISPIEAGDYYIKVTLKDDKNSDGSYKYYFRESLDPDGTYNTQRWMAVKFTINKKKVSVAFTYDADGLPSVDWSSSGDIYSRDSVKLGLKYSSTTGATLIDPYSVPINKGTYKATAYIEDEQNSNYELDASTITSNTFTITARKITDPVSTTGSATKTVTYNAAVQTLTLQNITADVKYTLSTGLTVDSYDASTGALTVSATNAGTYTIKADLADGGESTVWSSGGTATKTFTLKIDAASLAVTITLPASWEQGTAQTAKITLTGSLGNDDPALYVYYKASSGSEVTVSGSGENYSIPNDLSQGSYTFGVRIDSSEKNYTLTEKTQSFTVTAPGAGFDAADVVWKYTVDGITQILDGAGTENDPIEVEYRGKAYEFRLTLDSDALALKGVKATYSGDLSVTDYKDGVYSVTVKIEAKDSSVSYTTSTHTVYFKIDQEEIDLTNVPFEYSSDNGVSWFNYDPTNPPEIGGLPFIVRVPDSMLPGGVTSATASNYDNQFGPGTIDFDFTFTLDNNHKSSTGSNTVAYSMETTGKQIDAKWVLTTLKDSNGNDVVDAFGVPYYIYVLDIDPSDPVYKFINYEYYVDDKANGTYGSQIAGGLDTVIASTQNGGMGASSQNSVIVWARAYLGAAADGTQLPMTNGVANYVLKFSAAEPEYKKMTVGSNKRVVDVTAGVTSSTYGNSVDLTKVYSLTIRTTGDALDPSLYTVALYSGNNLIEGDIKNVDFTKLDAGTYKIVFDLLTDSYVLTATGMDFEVNPVELVVPLFKDGVTMTFNGDEQSIISQLDNFIATYMEFDAKSVTDARDAGNYPVVINIKEEYVGNYIFVMPDSGTTTVKLALTDGESVTDVEISNNSSTASYKWIMNKYVIDTTTSSAWKFASDGASLNLPTWVKALTSGADPTLDIQILYYDLDGNPLSEYELKGGNKFLVAAYINPDCAEAGNFDFKSSAVDPMTRLTTSPQVSYTVPKGGAAAFLGNLKDFATKTFLGLPVWAWLLIALALLILLIIIIVVASKRRKNKEEREAKKEAKEEEKRRREEEREDRMMRMQMGGGMPVTAAGMIAAQQQMPVQQQSVAQPTMGAVDNGVLAQIRAELAAVRNDQAAMRNEMNQRNMAGYAAPQNYAPATAPAAYPTAAPAQAMDYHSMYMEERARSAEARLAEERIRAAEEKLYHATEQRAILAEERFVRGSGYQPQQAQQVNVPLDADFLGTAIAAALRSNAQSPAPQPAQSGQEEVAKAAPAQYPEDAIITTTTTVDTSKQNSQSRTAREDRNFDVDGFYDKYE